MLFFYSVMIRFQKVLDPLYHSYHVSLDHDQTLSSTIRYMWMVYDNKACGRGEWTSKRHVLRWDWTRPWWIRLLEVIEMDCGQIYRGQVLVVDGWEVCLYTIISSRHFQMKWRGIFCSNHLLMQMHENHSSINIRSFANLDLKLSWHERARKHWNRIYFFGTHDILTYYNGLQYQMEWS